MTTDERAQGVGCLALPLAWVFIHWRLAAPSWRVWDWNGDGGFTIRDVIGIVGNTLSAPYGWTRDNMFPDVFSFLEIPPYMWATSATVSAGLLLGLLYAWALGMMVGYAAAIIMHWFKPAAS